MCQDSLSAVFLQFCNWVAFLDSLGALQIRTLEDMSRAGVFTQPELEGMLANARSYRHMAVPERARALQGIRDIIEDAKLRRASCMLYKSNNVLASAGTHAPTSNIVFNRCMHRLNSQRKRMPCRWS